MPSCGKSVADAAGSAEELIEILQIPRKIASMKLLPLALLVTVTGVFAQTAQLAPLPPDGFVTLAQVMSDFSSQPEAATQKYNGQRILVYGRVGQIAQSQDADGNPLEVYLQQADNTTPDVKCVFTLSDLPGWSQNSTVQISEDGSQASLFHRGRDGNAKDSTAYVTVGQTIGVHGTFDSFVAGDVVLKDCKKVRPEKLMEALKQHGIDTE